MYFKIFYVCVFISVTHESMIRNLPSSDDIRQSKVYYHKQTLCMLKVGQEICYNASKTPGNAEEIADIIRIVKYTQKAEKSKDKNKVKNDESEDTNDDITDEQDDGNEQDDEGEADDEETF